MNVQGTRGNRFPLSPLSSGLKSWEVLPSQQPSGLFHYRLRTLQPWVSRIAVVVLPSPLSFNFIHTILPPLGILLFLFVYCFFSYFLFLGWRFVSCSRTRCASTWFAYLDYLATFGFSLLTAVLWPHNLYLVSLGWRIRKETGGTADVVG